MKKKFCTIILAANFVTSTALFCGNTVSAPKKPEAPAAKVEPSTFETIRSTVSNLVDVKAHWTNHRNWFYAGGAAAVVAILVAAKNGKLKCSGKCPLSYFSKKGSSKPAGSGN